MQIIKVRNLENDVIEDWTIDQILNEINRDRSGSWTDYDESDWREGWNEWVEGEFYSLSDEHGILLTADESIQGQIIAVARDIMKTDFMQYPDYDPSIPTYLTDALTIIVSQHLEDVGTNEIYDFLKSKIDDKELEVRFQEWLHSDNVVKQSDGYRTQCSQYTKLFNLDELRKYFEKEYK